MSGLAGRVALVTGAGRGIGEGIVEVLAGHGMKICVNDLAPGGAARVAQKVTAAGGTAIAAAGDITRKNEVAAMFERAEKELGPLWLLVNNAGVYHAAPTAELSEEAWDQDFAVDVKGTFLCSQAAIRLMIPRREGRIVNLASIAGLIVRTQQLGYCSSKAAAIHLSRCLAVEMAPYGITVNCLCPGMTHTEMLMESVRAKGTTLEAFESLVPAGRLARPEDHGHLVAYLASPEAGHLTGQVISVDGGQSQNMPLVR